MVTKSATKTKPKKVAAKPAAKKIVSKPAKAVSRSAVDRKQIQKRQAKIKAKKRHWFKGRFGKKTLRRTSIEKWGRWRKSRGIDIKRDKQDGLVVDAGYRTDKTIRGLHPSGFMEARVFTPSELDGKQNVVIRIGRTVGKRKRKMIIQKANEMGLRILN